MSNNVPNLNWGLCVACIDGQHLDHLYNRTTLVPTNICNTNIQHKGAKLAIHLCMLTKSSTTIDVTSIHNS